MERTEQFTPPPEMGETGDVRDANGRVWPLVKLAVEIRARELGRTGEERRELIQEARLAMWTLDASRCDLSDRDQLEAFQRRLLNSMRWHAPKLRPEGTRHAVPDDLVTMLTEGGKKASANLEDA